MTREAPDPEPRTSEVWAPWATIGWGLIILFAFLVSQTGVVILYSLLRLAMSPGSESSLDPNNGLLLSLATLVSAGVCIPIVSLIAWLKTRGRFSQYIALCPVTIRSALLWCAIALALVLTIDGISELLDQPSNNEFMIAAYQTAGFLPLLWLAVCFVGPAFEEILFRGFLFTGLRRSRFGAAAAIIVPSLLWTAIHVQYGPRELIQIFLLGLVLGWSRERTGSLAPALAAHTLNNMVGMVMVTIELAGTSDGIQL